MTPTQICKYVVYGFGNDSWTTDLTKINFSQLAHESWHTRYTVGRRVKPKKVTENQIAHDPRPIFHPLPMIIVCDLLTRIPPLLRDPGYYYDWYYSESVTMIDRAIYSKFRIQNCLNKPASELVSEWITACFLVDHVTKQACSSGGIVGSVVCLNLPSSHHFTL